MRAEDISIGRSQEEELGYENGYDKGFNDCKQQVLQILKKDWTGLDMSINSCDQYYIDKIKKL